VLGRLQREHEVEVVVGEGHPLRDRRVVVHPAGVIVRQGVFVADPRVVVVVATPEGAGVGVDGVVLRHAVLLHEVDRRQGDAAAEVEHPLAGEVEDRREHVEHEVDPPVLLGDELPHFLQGELGDEPLGQKVPLGVGAGRAARAWRRLDAFGHLGRDAGRDLVRRRGLASQREDGAQVGGVRGEAVTALQVPGHLAVVGQPPQRRGGEQQVLHAARR
jgi:hypothetical protein